MKGHKKIYYTPGLISLVFLPLLMLWHLNKEGVFERFSVVEINSWHPNLDKALFPEYAKESHPKRNYTQIKLTGNEEGDMIKLRFAQLSMRELKRSEDIEEGVHIHFEDSSKYWALVKAIDICNFEHIKTWTLYKNDLWVFNFKKDLVKITAHQYPLFECGYYCDSPKVPGISPKEKVLFHLSRFYPLIILFIVLILATLVRACRQ